MALATNAWAWWLAGVWLLVVNLLFYLGLLGRAEALLTVLAQP